MNWAIAGNPYRGNPGQVAKYMLAEADSPAVATNRRDRALCEAAKVGAPPEQDGTSGMQARRLAAGLGLDNVDEHPDPRLRSSPVSGTGNLQRLGWCP